jgi:hypothetical protein
VDVGSRRSEVRCENLLQASQYECSDEGIKDEGGGYPKYSAGYGSS